MTPHTKDDPRKYLDPLTLAKVRSLELQARLHRRGLSLRACTRAPITASPSSSPSTANTCPATTSSTSTGRSTAAPAGSYLKQYEEETNLVCWIMLDVSESMQYGSGRRRCRSSTTPAWRPRPWRTWCCTSPTPSASSPSITRFGISSSRRARCRSSRKWCTSWGKASARKSRTWPRLFHDMAERINRRAIIFLLSDMFEEVQPILSGLKHLRHKRHEVVLWHILDAAELTFPFQESTLFRGLEQFPDLLTDPRALRQGYLDQIEGFIRQLTKRLPGPEHRLRADAHRHAARTWRCRAIWRIGRRDRRLMEAVMNIHNDSVPLRVDESGAIRVGNTRVLFYLVIEAYKSGNSAEAIVEMYDTLVLADVHAAVAYYLRHKDEVEVFLSEVENGRPRFAEKSRRINRRPRKFGASGSSLGLDGAGTCCVWSAMRISTRRSSKAFCWRCPELDLVRSRDLGLAGVDDPPLLGGRRRINESCSRMIARRCPAMLTTASCRPCRCQAFLSSARTCAGTSDRRDSDAGSRQPARR